MSTPISKFYVHTVTVKPFLGAGATGDVYGPAQGVVGFFDGGQKLVRTTSGEQVVTTATFYTDPSNADLFPPESEVTFNGQVSHALTVLQHVTGLDLPDHIEIALV